jgi:hypothetical protein
MEASPDLPRYRLARLSQSTYRWLRKHDRAWLESHVPPRRRPHEKRWIVSQKADAGETARKREQRDLALAKAVVEAAIAVRSEVQPRRMVLAYLKEYVPALPPEYKALSRFPHTEAAVRRVVETREEFLVRRVQKTVAQADYNP